LSNLTLYEEQLINCCNSLGFNISRDVKNETTRLSCLDLSNQKSLKIALCHEHSLMKYGAGFSGNWEITNLIDSSQIYYIRLPCKKESINKYDYFFSYSVPNILNIQKSQEISEDIKKKFLYLPPTCGFNLEIDHAPRPIDVLTNFTKRYLNQFGTRSNSDRIRFLKELKINKTIKHKALDNCFNKECLYKNYKNSKILINMRQTVAHDCFEEIRCLPALLSGCLVVSEDCVLKESIPYNKYIIWCKKGKALETTNEVLSNYKYYKSKIFFKSGLARSIKKLIQDSSENIKSALLESN